MDLRQDVKANVAKEHLPSKPGNDDDDKSIEDLEDLFYGSADDKFSDQRELDKEGDLRDAKYRSYGYREGIIARKEAAAQESFNIGYKESARAANKFGIVRGVTSAFAFLPEDLREKLVEDQETREKLLDLHSSVSALSTDDAIKVLMSKQGEEKSGGGSSSGVTAKPDLESFVTELSSLLEKTPKIEVKFDP